MIRVLTFDDTPRSQKRFELLYGAILVGGADGQRKGGIETIRREARILDALDARSVVNDDPKAPPFPSNEPARLVQTGALTLEQADFEILLQRMKDTPWLPKIARDVVDTVDWLTTAQDATSGPAE